MKQFVTLTGRKIRYLRIDDAEEFQSDEIEEYCAENDLQLVLAYNHHDTVVSCKPAWRVQLAASYSTAEHPQVCYTLTSPLISGVFFNPSHSSVRRQPCLSCDERNDDDCYYYHF